MDSSQSSANFEPDSRMRHNKPQSTMNIDELAIAMKISKERDANF